MSRDIHLVGSIPLDTADDVFQAVGTCFGDHAHRVPDGETGNRISWLGWQSHVFQNDPNFETITAEPDPRVETTPEWMRQNTWFKLKDELDPATITIMPLQYAQNAIESYKAFKVRKESGDINQDARFIVAIPAPFNILNSVVAPDDRIRIEPRFEDRMFQELDEICAAIPHDELALQWDCAHDMQAYDNARTTYFDHPQDGLVERWIRIGNRVPADVQLGYHFCYGSLGGKHFVEPTDMGAMAEAATRVCAGIGRTVEFFHMPVPIERDDDAYFEPLKDLKLRPETEFYLGLIHAKDGVDGSRKRMVAASKYYQGFGIATECGFGRRDPATIPPLLSLHVELAD